jgi:hypothetical protein
MGSTGPKACRAGRVPGAQKGQLRRGYEVVQSIRGRGHRPLFQGPKVMVDEVGGFDDGAQNMAECSFKSKVWGVSLPKGCLTCIKMAESMLSLAHSSWAALVEKVWVPAGKTNLAVARERMGAAVSGGAGG